MYCIPASMAALMPGSPSSKTTQSFGSTPNICAAFKNVSGCGLWCSTSSQVTTAPKSASLKPKYCRVNKTVCFCPPEPIAKA